MKTFSDLLVYYMGRKRMNNAEVARGAGASEPHMNRLVHGKSGTSEKLGSKIAIVLGLSEAEKKEFVDAGLAVKGLGKALADRLVGELPITSVGSVTDSEMAPNSADTSPSQTEEPPKKQMFDRQILSDLIRSIESAPDPEQALIEAVGAVAVIVAKQRSEQHRQNRKGHKTACL